MCSDLRTIAKSMTRVAKRRDDTGGSRVIGVRESREEREVDSRGRGTIRVVDWSGRILRRASDRVCDVRRYECERPIRPTEDNDD